MAITTKTILTCLLISSIIFAVSCKKDSSSSNDSIIAQSIHGQVYNYCTDSGLANVTVYLKIQGPAASSLQTVSGANGGFTFSVPVHSSDDYTYELYIPSKSGIGDVGFDGVDGYVIKSNISQPQVLSVVPYLKNCYIYLPNNTPHILYPDTFTLIIQQNTFHKNVPNGVYQLIWYPRYFYAGSVSGHYSFSSYPMGWDQTILDKTKNGVHTIKTDSFYVGWGATVTDTIPW